jgi:AraC-like DNA-binding protein
LLKGNISASFVQLLFDWVDEQGVSSQELLQLQRPTPGELSRVQVEQWRRLLEVSSAHFNEPNLGLIIGSRLKINNAGLLGYMAMCCNTLGEACLRLSQFEHLVYNVNPLRLLTSLQSVSLQWGTESGRPGALVDECAIAGLIGFCRSLAGSQASPDFVSFVNQAPANITAYEQFFQCELAFACEFTEVRYPLPVMAMPIATANPALQAALDQKARSLLVRLPSQGEPVAGLYRATQDALAVGDADLQIIAKRLLMSPRTLQRRLAEAGSGFQTELDKVRLALAKQYLSEGSASLQEIAWMLAYNDHSAFTHAFRRMTGQSPHMFRFEVP